MSTISLRSSIRRMVITIILVSLGAFWAGCTSPTTDTPSLREVGSTDMAVVTVAPAGYTGDASYRCTGVDDQIIINAAIAFIHSAYGGGKVQLLDGTYNVEKIVSASAVPTAIYINYDEIELSGNGPGTVIKYGSTGTNSEAIIGVAGNNCKVNNLKLATDSSIYDGIYNYASGLTKASLQNITIVGSSKMSVGIDVYSMANSHIMQNSITGCNYGIFIGSVNVSLVRITDNDVYSNNTGIEIQGDYCSVDNNTLSGNTTAGISIAATAASTSVKSNYCYNNAADTGIANTGGNFIDAGTATQVSSNSWQFGLGPVQPIVNADRSTSLVVNTSTNTAGTWSAAVTMPLPSYATGATAAWCLVQIFKAAAQSGLAIEAASGYTLSDITSGDNKFKYLFIAASVTGGDGFAFARIPIDTSAQFKWCTNVSSSTVKIGYPVAYEK